VLPGRSVLRWFRGVGGLSGSLACYLYLAGASGLACVYFAFPDRHLLLWTPLGASAVAATWVGVRRHRPAGQAAWVLFAAALGCFVTGDTVYSLTAAVSDAVNIPVIASGGAGTFEHFAEVFGAGHADAALAASIFHFQERSVRELKAFLAQRNVPIRP